jgi:iron-sulfur cluster assembly protein
MGSGSGAEDAARRESEIVMTNISIAPEANIGTTPKAGIQVTPKAIAKIRESFQKMGVVGGLRLGVLGGGCSGLSYQFKFEPKPRPTDNIFKTCGCGTSFSA